MLLGVLANYNKFEFQNPYRMRMGDFVNENLIRKIIGAVGRTCVSMRDEYVAVQDDSPEEWSVSGTLAYLGLGSLGIGKKPPRRTLDEEAAKTMFGRLFVESTSFSPRNQLMSSEDPLLTPPCYYPPTTLCMQTRCSTSIWYQWGEKSNMSRHSVHISH